jgi:hypothetical protein
MLYREIAELDKQDYAYDEPENLELHFSILWRKYHLLHGRFLMCYKE